MISRSYDRDTTKGGHEDALPIADQLVPFLEHTLTDNNSDYVFPGRDRQMLDEQTKLEHVLRRAMARAGLVTHYEHICRRCKHQRVLYPAHYIARFGEDCPAILLRKHLRCAECRGKMANLHASAR